MDKWTNAGLGTSEGTREGVEVDEDIGVNLL